MYKLSLKEIEVMLNKSAKASVKRVADWETGWVLEDKNGLITTANIEGNIALPI